jgi:Core-2/I-Branching enzyme
MSQIGFVVVTHSAPHQLIRLVQALNLLYSNPPIVIHHDFDQCPAELSFSSNVKVVQPHFSTQWCDYSVVRATLAGLALLYANSEKPDWFVLLSGACYPTKRAPAVISDLVGGGYDAYMDHQLIDPSSLRGEHQNEYFRRYFGFPWLRGANRHLKIGLSLLAPLFSPYSKKGYRCYAGSQWFTANQRVAEYILGWEESNPWLGKHLRNRHCPDETYFQTVLCNAPQFRVSENHFRFVDWSLGGAHPKVLNVCDLASILGSGAHFARKFTPSSPVLKRLDEYLGLADGI